MVPVLMIMKTTTEKIRIGNQSAFSAAALSDPFEYGIQNGFDAFEWFPDKRASGAGWDASEIGEETRRHIRNAARDRDIRLSVHAPWHANPLQPEGYDTLLADLGFAEEIGAGVLNIHLYTELGIDAYVKALLPLAERCAQAGIRLSIENTPLTSPQDFDELFARLRALRVSKETVGMCLDLGHANLCGPTRNDYLKFMDLLDPQVPIIHIHLHENYGDCDSHLTIFTGPAAKDAAGIQGFIRRIKQRGFSGSIILEQWPQPPSLLNQAREKLKAMLGENSTGE